MKWACSESVEEEETTRVCSRHLIKDHINMKDHILGVDTCYKSSDWLETSQQTFTYNTFLEKACLCHHDSGTCSNNGS